jgi:hypothetical protein
MCVCAGLALHKKCALELFELNSVCTCVSPAVS